MYPPGFSQLLPLGDFLYESEKSMTEYISIDDVMSVFNDYMRGEVDEEDTDTFLKMLKDKAESEDLGDYPDIIRDQFDNMTGSMNL